MSTETPDLLMMLDELVKTQPPGPAVTDLVIQPNGHIVVWTDTPHRRGSGREYVAFLDMGSVLALWSGQGVDLTPTHARALGGALTAWADRTDER